MATTLASNRNPADRNADATVHIAQLDDKVSDALLWELMVQAGPVKHVYIPRNRITGAHFGYGFCEFFTPLDALYAAKVFNLVHLYSKPIRISQSTVDRRSQDVGANLFIGNLVDEVDEKLLYDAFSAFGPIVDTPYIMRDPNTNESKRYGFVKYSSFDHADAAIAAMNAQYICNAPITVQYAFKKDSDKRERHGSQAERILAQRGAEARLKATLENQLRPHTLFSDRPATGPPDQRRAPVLIPPPAGYASNPEPVHQYPQQYNPQYPPPPQPQWQQAQGYQHPPPYRQQQQQLPSGYPPYQNPAPTTTQLGWSQNRHYGSRANGHKTDARADVPQQAQAHSGNEAPVPVSDERAPPAPHS